MPNDLIEHIGKQLRKVRQEKAITLQQVADRAGVTKSLVSRIENMRTVPSLPVLMNIIQALEVDISDFFAGIKSESEGSVIIRRAGSLNGYTKENAIGFQYFDIINKTFGNMVMKAALLELEPGSQREPLVTDGFEFKYVLEGQVDYKIGDQNYLLTKGDSLFFDARLPHVPINRSGQKACLLVIYFLSQAE